MATKKKVKEPKTFTEEDIRDDGSVRKSDAMTYRNFQPTVQTNFSDVKKLVIREKKFPDKSTGYDQNDIEFCCKEMRDALTVDGTSVALYPQGLVLRQADMRNAKPLKVCPYCGKEVVHQ